MKKQIKIDDQIFDFSAEKEKFHFESTNQYLTDILQFCSDWFNESTTIEVTTSGSTGAPKSLLMPKKWMVESATRTIHFFNLQKGNAILLALPVSFIAGRMMIVRAIVGELDLYTTPPASSPTIPNIRIHFAAFTPMQCHNLLEQEFSGFEKIEKVIIGGGAISPRLWQQLARLENNSFATYGMTETATHVAVQKVSQEQSPGSFQLMDGSIKMECDTRGCLSLQIPYFDNLKIQTNDIVKINGTDSFELLGRVDRVVNSGGRKIQLDQLEKLCSAFIDLPFYFCAVPDDVLGQKLVMLIETSDEISKEELFMVVNGLEKLDKPKSIEIRKKFNYTHSGKIIKEYFYEK